MDAQAGDDRWVGEAVLPPIAIGEAKPGEARTDSDESSIEVRGFNRNTASIFMSSTISSKGLASSECAIVHVAFRDERGGYVVTVMRCIANQLFDTSLHHRSAFPISSSHGNAFDGTELVSIQSMSPGCMCVS